MEGQISSGLLTRAAEAVAEKGTLQMLPQASNLFTCWRTSLPNPFGHSQTAPSIPTANPMTDMEEMYKNYTLSATRSNNNQYDITRPVVPPTTVPVTFARTQDSTKELGNWSTAPIHQQPPRHEWMCKEASNSLKLGPSSFSEESEAAPESAPVAFIDFLGLGAA
jgi:hypothetical protein